MNEILEKYLLNNNYLQLELSLNNAKIFYQTDGAKAKVLFIIELNDKKKECFSDLFQVILNNVSNIFETQGYEAVEFFMIFLAESIEDIRKVECVEYSYWGIELLTNRLIIYEGQPSDIWGLRSVIEKALEEQKEIGSGIHALLYKIHKFLSRRAYINLAIILINIIVFLMLTIRGSTLDSAFMFEHGAAFTPSIVEGGQYYRLFTSMFLHFGVQHIFNNMFVLFFVGDVLEKEIGKMRYLIVYLAGGLGGNIISLISDLITKKFVISAGASGAVFAVIGGLFYVVLVNKGKIPNLSIRRLGILIVLSLYQGFTSVGIDNYAHLGGVISGFLIMLLLYRKKHKIIQ
jgi:rhomboid protease GluP